MVNVEINEDAKIATLTTDKANVTYTLQKDNSGFIFFEFRVSSGNLPEELKGKYSSLLKGVEAFKAYERKMKQTQASKNEEFDKARKARRAELQSESS